MQHVINMNFIKRNAVVNYRNNYAIFLIDWVSSIIESNKIIIVEGKKDKKALVELGIDDNIIYLQDALYKVVDKIISLNKEVIILTDFDTEGKKLYSALKKGFEKEGVIVDKTFREALRRYTKVSHIEGMHGTYN
ncbi:toprim domain-containing protein [Candidatus Woesearchaeota archaeon]|nr:toprim domain-containing protein [Candidatus Woesearchaeota archaeon]